MSLYIAFEGIKGSGKTTVYTSVLRMLMARGFNPESLRPTSPGKNSFFDFLFQKCGALCPDFICERLYAARSNRAAAMLCKKTGLILGERSIITSFVTRWCYANPPAKIQKIRLLEHRISIPDHVIFLNSSLQVARQRIATRPRRRYGTYDQSPERLAEANKLYMNFATQPGAICGKQIKWHFVNANQPLEEVIAEAFSICVRLIEHQSKDF
jgi:thymidylate kinase